MNTHFSKEKLKLEDFSSFFLLKEMLRKVFYFNVTLNQSRHENIYEIFISNRFKDYLDMEILNQYSQEYGAVNSIYDFGVYGFSILSSYTILEILKGNNIFKFEENFYEYGVRILERGNRVYRETYPKRFCINGIWMLPLDLNCYNQETPYIVSSQDEYLDAINNYYIKEKIDFSNFNNHYITPYWLKEDNERGYTNDKYKEWL